MFAFVLSACSKSEGGSNGKTNSESQNDNDQKTPADHVDDQDDYDPETDPDLVDDPHELPDDFVELPKDWDPDITFSTTDLDLFSWDETCFAQAKVTMINLWAYWCGPCVGELPDIERLHEEYFDKGLQVFGLTYPEEESAHRQKLNELGLTYQMLLYTSDFDEYMDTGYIPVTIFIDNKGKVIDEPYVGSRSYDEWKKIIDSYLKG